MVQCAALILPLSALLLRLSSHLQLRACVVIKQLHRVGGIAEDFSYCRKTLAWLPDSPESEP